MRQKYFIALIIIGILIVGGVLFFLLEYKEDKWCCEDDDPKLVGGCAGVAPWYIQECCDNWAKENSMGVIACVGYWKIENNQCSWECGTPSDSPEACLINGGTWVEEQVGGFLDLGVENTSECEAWGGKCGERIISSFTIGKCDDNSDCWMQDIWEPTCILK